MPEKLRMFRLEITLIKIKGEVEFKLYQCKESPDIFDCEDAVNGNFQGSFSEVKVKGSKQDGDKTVMTIEIYESAVPFVDKSLKIIVVATNKETTPSKYAIGYVDNTESKSGNN